MKQHIIHKAFQLILRVSMGVLLGVANLGRGLRFSAIQTRYGLVKMLRMVAPGLLFVYLRGRKIKGLLVAKAINSRGNFLYILSHRYLAHSLVILIVIFVSIPSLLTAGSPSGIFGAQMLLKEVVGIQELKGAKGGVVIDDIAEVEEFNSYLEAMFQNQQTSAEQEDSDSFRILDGSAILKRELPGMTVSLTRAEVTEYEVQDGDTPWAIAEKFGISVSTVLWENNLNLWSTIRPGQKLTILPVSGVRHKTVKGDTLLSIAKKYNASIDEIREYNKAVIDGQSGLAVGLDFIIPGGRPYQAPQPKPIYRREIVKIPPPSAVVSTAECVWPADSKRITQYYKWLHAGLDIGDKIGNPIYACADGVVEIAGWGQGGWGYTVMIDHGNGFKTRYSHASKVLVNVGQSISRGEVVALFGSTGRSSGPHLDFRVYKNGRAVNPLEYLK